MKESVLQTTMRPLQSAVHHAGLLTGAYPRRIGMETWVQRADSNRGIHSDEVTIAELFKANGYTTACIGKWHLGDKKPFVPMAQGFDYHYGMYSNLDPVETVYFGDKGVRSYGMVKLLSVRQIPLN